MGRPLNANIDIARDQNTKHPNLHEDLSLNGKTLPKGEKYDGSVSISAR
jgi:hypothetical protein